MALTKQENEILMQRLRNWVQQLNGLREEAKRLQEIVRNEDPANDPNFDPSVVGVSASEAGNAIKLSDEIVNFIENEAVPQSDRTTVMTPFLIRGE